MSKLIESIVSLINLLTPIENKELKDKLTGRIYRIKIFSDDLFIRAENEEEAVEKFIETDDYKNFFNEFHTINEEFTCEQCYNERNCKIELLKKFFCSINEVNIIN